LLEHFGSLKSLILLCWIAFLRNVSLYISVYF